MTLDIAKNTSTLERILNDNILAYWVPSVLDTEYSGYRTIAENSGQTSQHSKPVITQARTLWFFSHLINCGRGNRSHVEAAHNGFAFLRDKMWDSTHGGFYWEVDPSGRKVLVALKHLYGQAFALYALSEYAIATKDHEASVLADEVFGLMEKYAHDKSHGGYLEFFTCDWRDISKAEEFPSSNDWLLLMSSENPTQKLFNTHLHLLEAITNYYRLSPDNRVRDRLYEFVLILSNTIHRKDVGGCAECYNRDWRMQTDRYRNSVIYGHNLENITILSIALDGLGLSQSLLMDFYRALFDNALRYGFDNDRGGFYQSGPFGKPADRRSKYAWTQAECLWCALRMYYLLGDEVFADCFEKTLGWIVDYQVDWVNGGWHCEILPDGEICHGQIESWNSPYHNGRSILQCLNLLESMSVRA